MQSQYKKRTDRSQSSIVRTMRQMGAQIHVTNMGNDFPDLLCGWRGGWQLIEVKELDGSFSRGQITFLAEARAHVDIVTSEVDASESLANGRGLTVREQERMIAWLVTNPDAETIRVKKLLSIIGRG